MNDITINGLIINCTINLKTKHKFICYHYIVLEISTTIDGNRLLNYSKLLVYYYGKS